MSSDGPLPPKVVVNISASWRLWDRLRKIALGCLVGLGWITVLGAVLQLANPPSPGNNSVASNVVLLAVFVPLSASGTWLVAKRGRGHRIHQVLWPTRS